MIGIYLQVATKSAIFILRLLFSYFSRKDEVLRLGLQVPVVSDHDQAEEEFCSSSWSVTVFIHPHSQALIKRETSGTFERFAGNKKLKLASNVLAQVTRNNHIRRVCVGRRPTHRSGRRGGVLMSWPHTLIHLRLKEIYDYVSNKSEGFLVHCIMCCLLRQAGC